jgi:hypothetical protein
MPLLVHQEEAFLENIKSACGQLRFIGSPRAIARRRLRGLLLCSCRAGVVRYVALSIISPLCGGMTAPQPQGRPTIRPS